MAKVDTIQEVLERSNPNDLADALHKLDFGKMNAVVKATFTGLTSAAAQNITTAAAKAAAVITGITLEAGENLPPIGELVSLRVTAGTLAAGDSILTDAGGTAKAIGATNNHVTILSDDGKTLTFQAAVTAFVLVYVPRSKVPLTDKFAPSV